MRTTADPKKLVRALQTGRRKLGMTDEDYRGLLSSVTGGRTTSSKELSGEELARALAALRKAGFRTTADPQIRKIKSLWYEMHDLGIVRNRSDQAIETYIRRITRAQKIEWCSVEQLQLVIETLKNWIALFLRTTTCHGRHAVTRATASSKTNGERHEQV